VGKNSALTTPPSTQLSWCVLPPLPPLPQHAPAAPAAPSACTPLSPLAPPSIALRRRRSSPLPTRSRQRPPQAPPPPSPVSKVPTPRLSQLQPPVVHHHLAPSLRSAPSLHARRSRRSALRRPQRRSLLSAQLTPGTKLWPPHHAALTRPPRSPPLPSPSAPSLNPPPQDTAVGSGQEQRPHPAALSVSLPPFATPPSTPLSSSALRLDPRRSALRSLPPLCALPVRALLQPLAPLRFASLLSLSPSPHHPRRH
jgi:hypothetical protein